ncbi:MAG TPA: hypothetical protein VFE50_10805 [Cyclobacteriaceae bacterium]|nr:hypothetical protein [Cyclobacteriaceae bacterium]
MRFIPIAVLSLIFSNVAVAQEFTNVSAIAQGSKIVISYTLIGAESHPAYTVAVFGSHDNFGAPIRLATGSVGKSIKPGAHIIEWDVRAELGSYKGEITFELRGIPELVALAVKSPKTVRQGKNAILEWSGGSGAKTVTLEVVQAGVVVTSLGERQNNGNVSWSVPKDMKKGSNFQLRVTSGTETAMGAPFAVKSKVPLLLKLSPIALLALIPVFLKGGGDDDPSGVTDVLSDLPGSPGPP